MENVKTKNTRNTVRLVIAIFFSIILVPVLIALVPAGGVAITAINMATQQSVEQIADEARISEEIYDVLMEEVAVRSVGGVLKPEVIEELAKDSVKQKDVDKLVRAFIDGVYNDKSKEIDLSEVEERLQENLWEIYEDSFSELYAAWLYGEPTKYFTEEYAKLLFENLERDFLDGYFHYGAANIRELKQKYDGRYGVGSFDEIVESRIRGERSFYEMQVESAVLNGVSKGVEKAEGLIEEAIDKASDEKALRDGLDFATIMNESSIIITIIVYVVIFGIVLVILLLYKFRTAGFVVSGIPLLIGGIGCKIVVLFEKMVQSLIDREVVTGVVEEERYQNIISSAVGGVLKPLFRGVSTYGTIMLISGGVLIVVGIACGVIRKHVCKNADKENVQNVDNDKVKEDDINDAKDEAACTEIEE